MARGAETQGAMDQSHFVDALTMYINDVVEGQLKPELEAAETATNQLRERVVALTTDSTNVKSQLTEKTKDAQRLDDRVVALVSEFKAAKAKVAAKNSVTTALEDEVVALKTALHKKSRAMTNESNSEWIWVCVVSLIVGLVHAALVLFGVATLGTKDDTLTHASPKWRHLVFVLDPVAAIANSVHGGTSNVGQAHRGHWPLNHDYKPELIPSRTKAWPAHLAAP
ncbi:hypothetical protein AeMF1_000738 [Aphanomyces euteiches]|nr:hypothetical protein AeMF1_000738 [Aphanomyces euteiches]